jgi:hypothetical protein
LFNGKQAEIEGIAVWRENKQHELHKCTDADHSQQQGCKHRPGEVARTLSTAGKRDVELVGRA